MVGPKFQRIPRSRISKSPTPQIDNRSSSPHQNPPRYELQFVNDWLLPLFWSFVWLAVLDCIRRITKKLSAQEAGPHRTPSGFRGAAHLRPCQVTQSVQSPPPAHEMCKFWCLFFEFYTDGRVSHWRQAVDKKPSPGALGNPLLLSSHAHDYFLKRHLFALEFLVYLMIRRDCGFASSGCGLIG
ncbi:hypothetical protein AJ79_08423 [Helicocarpus griseus UAMH5409]|uniref:Uncharacterized protein n=1 Tax=Helicocarpus griseus UAMH5409 TaxID=1447875 RepID=A0A2B7WTJ4_9EURO|nr:hypothetical protein AJ79_08423 [Helicocarpus griseus UAMH5409]